jgi:O-antigen/teichoic acid export membrane protein
MYWASDPARVGRILGLFSVITCLSGILFSGALLFFTPFIALHVFGTADINPMLRLAAVSVLFLTMNSFQLGALVGFEAFRTIARISVISASFAPAAAFLLTRMFELRGAVLALTLSSALLWTLCHISIRRECRKRSIVPTYRGLLQETNAFGHFAIPAALSGIIGNIAIWLANATVVRTPGGFSELGLFTACNTLRQIVVFGPSVVNRVTLPFLARRQSTRGSFALPFRYNLAFTAAASLATAFALFVFGPFILKVFGHDYRWVGGVAIPLLLAAVLEAVSAALVHAILVRNRLWWQAAINLLWSVLLVGTTALLASKGGAAALAMAYCTAWAVSAVLLGLAAKLLVHYPAALSATFDLPLK